VILFFAGGVVVGEQRAEERHARQTARRHHFARAPFIDGTPIFVIGILGACVSRRI
jgi:hypothetical protein